MKIYFNTPNDVIKMYENNLPSFYEGLSLEERQAMDFSFNKQVARHLEKALNIALPEVEIKLQAYNLTYKISLQAYDKHFLFALKNNYNSLLPSELCLENLKYGIEAILYSILVNEGISDELLFNAAYRKMTIPLLATERLLAANANREEKIRTSLLS